MMIALPQYVVEFNATPRETHAWVVNGDEELDTLCKVLRWNGITSYSVKLSNE